MAKAIAEALSDSLAPTQAVFNSIKPTTEMFKDVMPKVDAMMKPISVTTAMKRNSALIPTMTIFTMKYTNDVICQLISNLSDSGYLQMPDEDV